MMKIDRRRVLAGTGVLLATGFAGTACGGSSRDRSAGSNASTRIKNARSAKRTTVDRAAVLQVIREVAFEHLDPQNIYVNDAQAIGRLMFRSLMAYRENPETGTFTLVPDLASAMPTHNADNTVWTFRLRAGVRFADGSPVTAADIKYGVERSMDPNVPYGPQYARQYLAGANDYAGPSKGGLPSIVVPDPQTIVFHLAEPVGTWAELCTLSTFVPVPQQRDTGKQYDLNPVCLGPYMIRTYHHDTELTLIPNPYWNRATDLLRSQNFSQVVVRMDVDGDTVDQELFADAENGTLATFDRPQPANVEKATGAAFAARTHKALTAFIGYFQVSTRQHVLQNQLVRQALVYARDPLAAIKAEGGSQLAVAADSLAPPFLAGFGNVPNLYPDLGPHGNPAKARQLLQEAGVTDLRVTVPIPDLPSVQESTQAIVQGMARAGITAVPVPLSANAYYTTVSNPANRFDLYEHGWGYDIPDASTIFPPLFRGGNNLRNGSYNFAGTDVPLLDAAMAKALALTPVKALPIWLEVNRYLIEQALAIPATQAKMVTMVGSRVRGAYISPVLGNLDISNAYIAAV